MNQGHLKQFVFKLYKKKLNAVGHIMYRTNKETEFKDGRKSKIYFISTIPTSFSNWLLEVCFNVVV